MSPNLKDGTKTGKEPVSVSRTRWNQAAGTVISQRHILELPLLMARTGNASGEQQRYKLGPSSAFLAASFLSLPQRQPAAFSWRRMAAALRPLPSPLPSLPRAGLRAAGLCGPHPAHGPGSGRRGRAGPGRAVPCRAPGLRARAANGRDAAPRGARAAGTDPGRTPRPERRPAARRGAPGTHRGRPWCRCHRPLSSAPRNFPAPPPARARRPRAPGGAARARGCPLPAGAEGTARHGTARHAARGPRAPTSCWELQRATRRSLSSQCSGTEARRDAAPCLLRKPRQGVKELSPRCADGKRVRELEVKPAPITCSSQPSIHPSRSQRSRTSPGTPPQR